jgi:UDP-N-acetylglucosamine 4-epimerase
MKALVTGAAGFIGSHLVETLLRCGQRVVGLDNLSTGHARNLAAVRDLVGAGYWENFSFREADIRDRDACDQATRGIDYVLHQAALGSVPRSVADPLSSHDSNVTGFINMLDAARRAGVKRFSMRRRARPTGTTQGSPSARRISASPFRPMR